ncbi:uncharacterized protein LOC119169286 [Rhipicephalus microplus]|uniref:uncharacterized protein LOC119169286 n=1 Tax=Rhipicephalus microplus TaxID=6941 RepID=UPI003F6D3514
MNFDNACYQLGVLNRLTGCAKLHLCVMAAATPRKRRGPKYCCVVGCYNTADNIRARGLPIKLYRFPGKSYEKERRETWITAVRRINPDGTPWLPKDHTRICSTHFQGNRKSDIREHPAYIPTIFPSVYRQKARDQQKAQRLERCFQQNFSNESLQALTACPSNNSTPKEHAICQTEECVAPGKLSIFLSVTNGSEASTQVAHPEMNHKVAITDENWKQSWISWISVYKKRKSCSKNCVV